MGTYCEIIVYVPTLYDSEKTEELAEWMHENLMEVMNKPEPENGFLSVSARKFLRDTHQQKQGLAQKLKEMEDKYYAETWGAFNPQVFLRPEQSDRLQEWDWRKEDDKE